MTDALDQFDKALLNLVQGDARLGADALGQKTGLSPATVHRRLKRLREQGVIASEIAVLNGDKIDRPMTFVVNVEIERERVDLLETFKEEMRSFSQVQQCYYVTGDSDFVLIVKARDMDEYGDFTREAFFDNSNVRRFRTSVVMGEVKVGLNIPL